jgi:hypothetical protein
VDSLVAFFIAIARAQAQDAPGCLARGRTEDGIALKSFDAKTICSLQRPYPCYIFNARLPG